MPILIILALVVAILAVLFAVQNTDPVQVSLLFWNFTQPLALILLIVLALGVLIGLLATSPGMVRRSFTISSQRKRIDTLEKDLQQHKTELAQVKQTLDESTNPPEEQASSAAKK
jgi:uncharacterized integral membrane protein